MLVSFIFTAANGLPGTASAALSQNRKTSKPEKIVSLSPAVTEILFAIGARSQIAARTDYCDWPPEAAEIPSAGGFDGKATSLEKILSFRPDLVCLTSGMHDHLIAPLAKYGIPVFISSAQTVDAVLSEIRELARITGREQEGAACTDLIRNQLSQAASLAEGKTPVRVFWEVSAVPYFTCGSGSFINDMIRYAGAHTIFEDVMQPYPQVSEESIIARAPDVIIVPDYGNPDSVPAVFRRRAWQQVPAVMNGRVFSLDAAVVSRPGPRIGQAVLLLAQLFYTQDTH